LAKELNIRFLGRIPLDPKIGACCEQGQSFFEANKASPSLETLKNYVSELKAAMEQPK